MFLMDVAPEEAVLLWSSKWVEALSSGHSSPLSSLTCIIPSPPGSGDLFDFDFEVEPILEVLVGKVLEQGLMEVLEEEELAAMRAHQEHFEQIRNAELVATQRMEAAEMRKIEEKERRLAQERDRVQRERVVREKVAASTFSRGFLSGIVSSVFDGLVESGHFFDPVLREVETAFMPWLKEQAAEYLSQGVVARQVNMLLISHQLPFSKSLSQREF